MTTLKGQRCSHCGHENPSGARFCNQCSARLEGVTTAEPVRVEAQQAPRKAPTPSPSLSPAAAAASAQQPPPVAIPHGRRPPSVAVYSAVFATLAVITVVEIGIFFTSVAAFKVPSLLLLSAAKFALVIMFFMHLKGDRRFYSLLFMGLLFIGAAILVSLVGIFRKW